jgi:hypothetical protein
MRSPLSLSLSFEREGKGELPRKSTNMRGYAMTNNEVACRCNACRKESNNGKGLMWNRALGDMFPIRDLEVNA